MNSADIQFEIIRDDQGLSGFKLYGVGETDAETFCLSFLTAQGNGKGLITFKDGKIIFTHGGVSLKEANPQYGIWGAHQGGIFSTEITPDDAKDLSDLLNLRGKYTCVQIRVRPELAWGKGFTLYVNRD